MGIDPKTLRPGDAFLARHVVGSDGFVHRGYESYSRPNQYDIISVEPRPIEVGDTVEIINDREAHEVIGVDGLDAWVKSTSGHRHTVPLSLILLAPHDTITGEG